MFGYGIVLLFNIIGLGLTFEVGTIYKYSYETTVALSELCREDESSPVAHRLKANVHFTPVWENERKKLIRIELHNAKLSVPVKSKFAEHSSDLNKMAPSPSFVLLQEGEPKQIWDNPTEHLSLRNLKRGLATLLYSSTKDKQTKEIDVSGECDVIYKVQKNNVQRRKGNCIHSKFDKTLSQAHSIRSSSTHVVSLSDCNWSTKKSPTPSKCTVNEHVRFYSTIWHRNSLCINSRSELNFEGIEKKKELQTFKNEKVEAVFETLKKSQELDSETLESILPSKEATPKRKLSSSVEKAESDLKAEKLATLKSAVSFYKLLPVFRTATSDEVLQVLKDKKLFDIRPQILDAVSACATEECLKAGLEFFQERTKYHVMLERFLISLSVLPRPTSELINKLREFLEHIQRDERIEATLLSTLGTVLRTYADNHAIADPKVVENTRLFLESRLKACNKAESKTCEFNHIRSLRNAASPLSTPVLLEYAGKGGDVGLEALLALRSTTLALHPDQSEEVLLKIFNQIDSKQDRSARAIAAELLLSLHPKVHIIKNLLLAIKDQKDNEFSAFLASKIMNLIEKDDILRVSVMKLLPEKDINYYQTLAQGGKSALFRRPMATVEGTNVTFGMELELLGGGLLKRTVFDIGFDNAASGHSKLMSVGIFARGLGSVAGVAEDFDPMVSDPTAGVNLGFLDSALRPYILFKSVSELMGHVMSGAGSDPTPVLQNILTFSDDERIFVLSNGMSVRGQLRSVLSLDSSASIQVSLWNRNSKSLVVNKAALFARGAVTVDSGFATVQGTLQFSGEAMFDFRTHLEFYEAPFQTCMSMEHPPFTVKLDLQKMLKLNGTGYELKKKNRRMISIPGRSFAFDKRNNEMCALLNEDS